MLACIPATGQYDPAGAFWAVPDPIDETNVPGLAGVILLEPNAVTK
jgi:hypothetical protein